MIKKAYEKEFHDPREESSHFWLSKSCKCQSSSCGLVSLREWAEFPVASWKSVGTASVQSCQNLSGLALSLAGSILAL